MPPLNRTTLPELSASIEENYYVRFIRRVGKTIDWFAEYTHEGYAEITETPRSQIVDAGYLKDDNGNPHKLKFYGDSSTLGIELNDEVRAETTEIANGALEGSGFSVSWRRKR